MDFLLDHGVAPTVNPKAWNRARERFRQSGRRVIPLTPGCWPTSSARNTRTSRALQPELRRGPGVGRRNCRAADPAATRLRQPADGHAEGVLRQGPGGWFGWTTRAWRQGVPAGLSDAGRRGQPRSASGSGGRAPIGCRSTRSGALGMLQQPRLPVPAHVVRAKAQLMQTLLTQLGPVVAAVREYRQAVEISRPCRRRSGRGHYRSVSTGSPGPRSGLAWGTPPGSRESFQHLQAQAGAVPVTKQSGEQQVVQFRSPPDEALRHVVDQMASFSAALSRLGTGVLDQQRARGHSRHRALRPWREVGGGNILLRPVSETPGPLRRAVPPGDDDAAAAAAAAPKKSLDMNPSL